RRGLVPRPRLLDRLDEGLRRRLVLVSAPAGFGKTTLLAEWLGGLAGDADAPTVAWLSLDEGDSDPARFAAYLAAALARADGDLGAAGAAPATGAWLGESHLVPLLNRVADLAQTFILVLDDYHLITSQSIHEAVGFVLEHAPPNLHLVLATRADPPQPLPRLRARGQLVELRQSDLRFTADEAATFLHSVAGLDLSAADVAALEARTEGWIAGLQMAALAMQRSGASRAPASGFVQALTGSHRFILDYLVEEVLEQQPSEVQHFLLCTSILDRLCAPLCDALLA
ncbi:MAG: hypothetical protein P8129_14405, partial [Anaerolineae bacterium]